jgi:cobalt/nickel transport system permease protein
MHMADALLSPVVGGVFWAASAGLIGYSAKKISQEDDIAKTPLMGVMGAFIFAVQMINFAIPGTGSSGHLGGGLLLTALLGPWRAFITLASVLVVQCLFFADGGLLALGCNIFNLAFFPAFIAYPFIFRKIAGRGERQYRLATGSILAAVVGLELGAFSVVIQTILSGSTDLPFGTFAIFMLPIHLAIGLVEGVVTWAVLAFVHRVQPSLLTGDTTHRGVRPVLAILAIAALLTGGVIAYFASENPDGLEWAIGKTGTADETPGNHGGIIRHLARFQEKLSFLPDYNFREGAESTDQTDTAATDKLRVFGTSAAGVAGSIIVLAVALGLGLLLRKHPRPDGSTS